MKRLKTVGMLVLAAVLGGWGMMLFEHANRPLAATPGTPAASPAADDAPRNAPASEELRELRRRLERLEAKERAPATAPTVAPKGEGTPERDPRVVEREQQIARWMDDHYTPEVQSRVFGAYFVEADAIRLRERPDREWIAEVTQGLPVLLQRLREQAGPVTIEQFDCGSTLCRLRLGIAKREQRGTVLHAIQHELGFDEASAYMPATEDKMDAYLARAGSSLPLFDQVKYVGAEMDRSMASAAP